MECGIGKYLLQGAFQLTHIGPQVLCNVERHLIIELDTFNLSLLFQDGNAHFDFRRFDLYRQTPVEAGDQAVLQPGNILRIGIATDHDLFLCFN